MYVSIHVHRYIHMYIYESSKTRRMFHLRGKIHQAFLSLLKKLGFSVRQWLDSKATQIKSEAIPSTTQH